MYLELALRRGLPPATLDARLKAAAEAVGSIFTRPLDRGVPSGAALTPAQEEVPIPSTEALRENIRAAIAAWLAESPVKTEDAAAQLAAIQGDGGPVDESFPAPTATCPRRPGYGML